MISLEALTAHRSPLTAHRSPLTAHRSPLNFGELNPMNFIDRFRDRKSQSGINMVDLMMWLVIAALLLAAAIQGIGYYHRAATLANMESDAMGAGTNVMSASSMDQGVVDLPTVNNGASNSKWTNGVTHTVENPIISGKKPYIRVSSPDVTDADVIYLFDSCSGYRVGVNVIPKNSNSALLQCGVDFSGAQPITDSSPAMSSVWDTSLTGCSTIKLPLSGAVNATIDWGDGSKTTTTTANPTHTYSGTPGPVLIKTTGTFTAWSLIGNTSAACISRVTGWGSTGTKDLSYGFYQASNLTSIAQIPAGVTSLNGALRSASIFNGDISNWDTSSVTDMNQTFMSASAFNQNISNWDTSKVTRMSSMFFSANAFNQPIGNWNTSKVTNMSSMFTNTVAFNQPIGNWDTSSLTDISSMFTSAAAFNQPIGNWNTSRLTNMQLAFNASKKFNQDISGWNTSNVTNMSGVFQNNTIFNQPIGNWDTTKVTDMSSTFAGATRFNQDISGWKTSNVTNMTMMFQNATVFNQNISGWNVAAVTSFTNFYIGSGLPVSSVPPKFR